MKKLSVAERAGQILLVHSAVTIIHHIGAMKFAQAFLGLHSIAVRGFDLVHRFRLHRGIRGLGSAPRFGSVSHQCPPDSLNMSGITLGVSLPK